MKAILTVLILMSSMNAGFFNENETEKDIEVKKENERLCTLFTNKAKEYKTNMRQDELAQKTLESYEKRANIYCTKS
jgi:hypothetical protein